MDRRISVCMVAPRRKHCGVTDYSDHLLAELRNVVDIRWVTDAAGFRDDMNAADIIHVQHQYFLFGGVAPWKSGFRRFADRIHIPAVLTAHEFVEPAGNPARRAAIAAANRHCFLHPAIRHIIVHTESDRIRMVRSGGPADRLSVIRLGVPPGPTLTPSEEAKAALGLSGRFVITIYGFLSRKKGHAVAIEAIRELPENVVLLLAGGRHPDDHTDYVDGLERLVKELRLDGRVRITGWLSEDNAARCMSATDLILAPFTESSGSASLAYAFACGKPILASDIAPNTEILSGTDLAIRTFRSPHPHALALEVSSLMEYPECLARLAEASWRYGREHSCRKMAEETAAVYRRVLENAT